MFFGRKTGRFSLPNCTRKKSFVIVFPIRSGRFIGRFALYRLLRLLPILAVDRLKLAAPIVVAHHRPVRLICFRPLLTV